MTQSRRSFGAFTTSTWPKIIEPRLRSKEKSRCLGALTSSPPGIVAHSFRHWCMNRQCSFSNSSTNNSEMHVISLRKRLGKGPIDRYLAAMDSLLKLLRDDASLKSSDL